MNKTITKIFSTALLLLAFTITLTAQPMGSKIKVDTNSQISYWNGVDTWIPVTPGLPGQILQFIAGIPTWVNNPSGITTTLLSYITGFDKGGNILSDGGDKIISRGVCWSSFSTNPTIADSHTIDGNGIGDFSSNPTGLIPGLYYFKAYATNSIGTAYGNLIILNVPAFNSGIGVTDYDDNFYESIVIGTQEWMNKNLNVTHYRNGDAIPNITDNNAWWQLTTGAYCNYNNDVSNSLVYGKLYNWYTVTDSRGLCPTGWHTPSYAEWTTLRNYLGNCGLTELKGGIRIQDGSFAYLNTQGVLWSSDEYIAPGFDYGKAMLIVKDQSNLLHYFNYKFAGISVRCLKD